jgi:2-oxoglutarate ferredoxin oxidoreductase subunit gamma
MANLEIRLCGFGGQGIILAGFITGQAATVYDHRNAVLTQDYGPEARGGSCRADVIISDEPVLYPYIDTPDTLVALSQEAYEKYSQQTRPETLFIIDEDLVKPYSPKTGTILMPARRIAAGLGRAAIANVAMLGFLTACTKIVTPEAMKQSVLASVPRNTGKLNMAAFDEGYAAGLKVGASK